jgi:hypothetical protein
VLSRTLYCQIPSTRKPGWFRGDTEPIAHQGPWVCPFGCRGPYKRPPGRNECPWFGSPDAMPWMSKALISIYLISI